MRPSTARWRSGCAPALHRSTRTARAARRARYARALPSPRSWPAGARAYSGRAGRRQRSAAARAPRRAALHAEEHHAEEGRLQEKCREHLVGEERPRDVADVVHVARPVGAELEAHRHARDHAHREGQREHPDPQLVRAQPRLVARHLVADAEPGDDPCEPDGDRREEDVEADVQAELDAGQNQRFFHRLILGPMDRPAYCLPDEAEFMARGWWRDEDTLWEWLQRHARTRADQPAVVSSGGAISWQDLCERVLRVAAGLQRKGIEAGDVVALQLPNAPQFPTP